MSTASVNQTCPAGSYYSQGLGGCTSSTAQVATIKCADGSYRVTALECQKVWGGLPSCGRFTPLSSVADVAQLVARHLAKVNVAGSNPVVRSESRFRLTWWSGREARQRPAKPRTRVQIPSPPPGRLAQRESASLTRKRSLVQSQYRPPLFLFIPARTCWL